MRRGLRLVAALALALALLTTALGLVAARAQRTVLETTDGLPVRGALELGHAVSGHAAALAGCAAAAIAFVLGLQGLLETGGNRVRGGLLFALGPVLMGLALAVEVSGLRGWRGSALSLALQAQETFLRGHEAPGLGFVIATAVTVLAAWALARPDDESEGKAEED